MATIIETIQKRSFLPTRPLKEDLPTFTTALRPNSAAAGPSDGGLRKRLSSFSLNFQPASHDSAFSFSRSGSMPSLNSFSFSANPIKNWLDWGLGWILSRKLDLASDLEMNEEEMAVLGSQSKGSLRHLLYRAQLGFRRLFVDSEKLPMTQKVQSGSHGYN